MENFGDETAKKMRPQGFGIRYCQCAMLAMGYGIASTRRTSLSLIVVGIQEEQMRFQKEMMTQGQIGMILSSFLWGYAAGQIPLGHLARIWSARMVLVIGLLLNGLVSLSTPFLFDEGGWIYLLVCNIIVGLCQSCLPSCCHTLASEWAPPTERGRFSAGVYSGAQLGVVISLPVTGVLIAASSWRSPFYVCGAAAVIWSVVFYAIGSDSPAAAAQNSCCGISEAERNYIESGLGVTKEKTQIFAEKRLPTPWMAILTNVPSWALLIVHCAQKWGYYMLLTEIPIYMNGVLRFNIKENGLISALPYIVQLLLMYPTSCLSDWGEKRGVSRGLLRKSCNTVGQWGPTLALVGICFVLPGDSTLAVVLLVVAVAMNAGAMCGFQINHLDLSLEYAGLLMSITNGLGSVVGLLAPLAVGLIVTDSTNADEWKIVFIITGAIYFLGNLIFILFGSGENQGWDNSDLHMRSGNDSWRPRTASIADSVTTTV